MTPISGFNDYKPVILDREHQLDKAQHNGQEQSAVKEPQFLFS